MGKHIFLAPQYFFANIVTTNHKAVNLYRDFLHTMPEFMRIRLHESIISINLNFKFFDIGLSISYPSQAVLCVRVLIMHDNVQRCLRRFSQYPMFLLRRIVDVSCVAKIDMSTSDSLFSDNISANRNFCQHPLSPKTIPIRSAVCPIPYSFSRRFEVMKESMNKTERIKINK